MGLLLKTPVRIALGLLAAYFLFAWFGFEPLVKWAAPKVVADKSQHHLVIGTAKFDPLALSVRVGGLKLTEPDGKPLLAFDELFVDFEAASLFRWAYTFQDIRLSGADAHVVLLPDGTLNWTALIEAFKSEEDEEDKDLPRLLIDRITLAKGRAQFTDRKVVEGYQVVLNPIDFTLTDLSTLPDDKGAYTLATRTEAGARVRWKGQLTLNPVLATGELSVDDVQLARVWPYVQERLNMETPAGVAALGLTYRVAYDNKQLSLALDDLGFKLEGLKLRGRGDAEAAIALDGLQLTGGRFDLQQRRLDIAKVALQGGHVHVQRRADGSIDLTDWFRPSGAMPVVAVAGPGVETGFPALVPGAKGSVDDLGNIQPGSEVRLGGLAFAYKSTQLHADSLPRLDKVVRAMEGNPDLRVHIGGHTDSIGSDPYNLRMSQARAESVRDYLAGKGITAERMTTRGYGEGRPVADNATEAGREANRRVVLRFHLPNQGLDDAGSQGGSAPGVWAVNLEEVLLDGLGVRYRDTSFAQPLSAEVGNVKAGFKVQAQAGVGAPQAQVGAFGVNLSAIRLASEASPRPLLLLEGVNLEGGRLDLAAREAGIARLALVNGKVDAERDSQGLISLVEAFKPGSSAPAPASMGNGANASETPWKYRLDRLELSGFEVAVRDRSVSPVAGLTLQRIQASVEGLSQDLNTSLPVKLSLGVKEGGTFRADGKVVIANSPANRAAGPAADLALKLGNLNLRPVQPYISQAANLTLASGSASGAGRLKYDGKLSFNGGFQVMSLLLNESEGGARFLAWKRLESDSVRYTPEALNIEELKVDGLGAKLVIDQDKTVNLKKILKPQVAPKAAPPPVTVKVGGTATRMNIDRIRVENGELDFADHSLALPFGTRIHHFKGALNGISTRPGSAAQLELDGLVDEFGLARAVGQLDLFDPTAFMDIKVVFRNVEMTNLTPYTATFVGRKIASGKLSLDLEYKIKARQLLGENQIIMDQLTLGERVESPTAKNLPLDLAIAILQDSDGRIDLGLPVSGSLDDPQFSYGRIIWKAIGNIITKIVTAPFRALASLFGGDSEKMEKIAFEAGEAGLMPPEKEKLKQIAQVLKKRPGLALTVHPAWSAGIDRPVVQETRLRRAVAEKMGLKLKQDEDPGPVSTANAKAQTALESLYAAQFGEESWKILEAQWFQANPENKQGSGAGKLMSRLNGLLKKEDSLSEVDMSALKGADLHALLYERLLAKESVSDGGLSELASHRGQSILAGLATLGIPADRMRLGETKPMSGEGREVPARLELGLPAK